MKKRMIIMLVSVGVVFGGIFGFQQFKAMKMAEYFASMGQPPATVTAMKAEYSEWQPHIRSVGTLRALHGVDVVSEVNGIVEKVHFKSGDMVKAGALLVELDAESEKAQLAAAEAAAGLAAITYKRDQTQFKVKAVSQAQIDADLADLKAKKAQVAQLQAVVDKLRIRAPFAGRLGVTTISRGQYLSPADVIVSLQANNPILIDFNLPQKYVGHVKVGQKVVLSSDAFGEREFDGEISAIDSKVNVNTRNVHVEAKVDNSDGRLLPGMFAEVKVETGKAERFLTLPQTAISYNAYGATVFLARPGKPGKDGKEAKPVAEQVFVKTGATRGDQVALLSGVAEGDMVVTSGQMKLKNGTPLIINNSHPPANDPAPTPQEH
jgi:membrane fusion protein (multidrug efflux system)